MYGRETPVGYQKLIFTGNFKPAALSSAYDFAGL
jgi:hypothetical protein